MANEPGGISERDIRVIRMLIEAFGELLDVPRPKIEALSARVRADLRSLERTEPEIPDPEGGPSA